MADKLVQVTCCSGDGFGADLRFLYHHERHESPPPAHRRPFRRGSIASPYWQYSYPYWQYSYPYGAHRESENPESVTSKTDHRAQDVFAEQARTHL